MYIHMCVYIYTYLTSSYMIEHVYVEMNANMNSYICIYIHICILTYIDNYVYT
jgi:hypothetical protein